MVQRGWKTTAALALIAGLGASAARAGLTISSAATQNVTCNAHTCKATAADAVLNATDLEALLAEGSVAVKSLSTAQDITVAAPLTWTSGVTLTLDAFHTLTVSQPVSVTGTGGLTILTDDGGTGGVFSIGAPGKVTFASLSSPLTINGHAYVLANSVRSLAANIAASPKGYHALATSYDAGGDNTYNGSPIKTLSGTLDGLGNIISNLHVNAKAFAGAGLVA